MNQADAGVTKFAAPPATPPCAVAVFSSLEIVSSVFPPHPEVEVETDTLDAAPRIKKLVIVDELHEGNARIVTGVFINGWHRVVDSQFPIAMKREVDPDNLQ